MKLKIKGVGVLIRPIFCVLYGFSRVEEFGWDCWCPRILGCSNYFLWVPFFLWLVFSVFG